MRVPDRLYKYQPPTEHAIQNLRNRQLWFGKPCRFNDPFDCAIRIDRRDVTDSELWELFHHQQQR